MEKTIKAMASDLMEALNRMEFDKSGSEYKLALSIQHYLFECRMERVKENEGRK
jgi:hypothetical protein